MTAMTLFIVDDHPAFRRAARRTLSAGGFDVVGEADGVQTARAALDGLDPGVVLLDVNLPDGNGFEALSALRQDPTYAELPIIMVTVRGEAHDIARGLSLGADGYVTKPYGKNTLEYVLRYVMKQELPGTADLRAAA